MSQFTGALTITEIDAKKQLWRIEEELTFFDVYYSMPDGTVYKKGPYTVPAKFISDGASVPFWLEWFTPRWGKYRRPAIMHDYYGRRISKGNPHPDVPTYAANDKLFWKTMGIVGTGLISRCILFGGAKLGSWFPWMGKSVLYNDELNDLLDEQAAIVEPQSTEAVQQKEA